jgi:type II secretory pathway pseudopilin PulG
VSRSRRAEARKGRADRRSGGFTLIEALVALALVLAFAAALTPHLFQSRRIVADADSRVAAHVLLRTLLDAPFDRANLAQATREGDVDGLRWRIVTVPLPAAAAGSRAEPVGHQVAASWPEGMPDDQSRDGAARTKDDGRPPSPITARDKTAAMTARAGFTLVECSPPSRLGGDHRSLRWLIHNVALNFDRGTKTVDVAERFVLAIDRLSADFASARAVARRSEAGPALAFLGEPGGEQTPGKILFVAAAPVTGAPPGDEVVMLTVEQDEKVTRLVRRRASWPGPSSSFDDVAPDNPVVLIEGKWSISFLFGRLTPELEGRVALELDRRSDVAARGAPDGE